MSTTQMISEREAVLRERAAARKALAYFDGTGRGADRAQQLAAEWFPLPKIRRPRIVSDPGVRGGGVRWRLMNGQLQWNSHSQWNSLNDARNRGMFITAERVRVLADLLANPTEEVSDDGSGPSTDGGQ